MHKSMNDQSWFITLSYPRRIELIMFSLFFLFLSRGLKLVCILTQLVVSFIFDFPSIQENVNLLKFNS
jgi:hypothetical protein